MVYNSGIQDTLAGMDCILVREELLGERYRLARSLIPWRHIIMASEDLDLDLVERLHRRREGQVRRVIHHRILIIILIITEEVVGIHILLCQ